jgi:hypothetical protein
MKDIKEYMRVTEVLSPLSGLSGVNPDVLKNAQKRGTDVHEVIDAKMQYIGGGNIQDEWKGYISSFDKWFEGKDLLKISRWFCDEYKITGECDALYMGKKGLTLVDFKTPTNESKTWRLQGSAYSYLGKQAGYEIKNIEFVKLSKDGTEPKIYQYEEDFDMFLKCLCVYNYFFKYCKHEDVLDFL